MRRHGARRRSGGVIRPGGRSSAADRRWRTRPAICVAAARDAGRAPDNRSRCPSQTRAERNHPLDCRHHADFPVGGFGVAQPTRHRCARPPAAFRRVAWSRAVASPSAEPASSSVHSERRANGAARSAALARIASRGGQKPRVGKKRFSGRGRPRFSRRVRPSYSRRNRLRRCSSGTTRSTKSSRPPGTQGNMMLKPSQASP